MALTWCSARATWTAAGSPTGALAGARSAAWEAPTRGRRWAYAIQDLTGGFKVFRRRALEAIDLGSLASLGYAFQVETTFRTIRAGLRVVEVPIIFRDRRVGQSKMTGSVVLEAAWRVPAMRLRGR